MVVSVLTDRLAAGLSIYIENYLLSQNASGWSLKPSYMVDYKIDDIDELDKHTGTDEYWLHIILGSERISDLPEYLQKLVRQYLPRFFADYPQYINNKYFID